VSIYTIYEKVQVTIFFIQEVTISSLYLAATVKFFRLDSALYGKSAGKMMRHLILINVLIIILDAFILGLEYAGYYTLQTSCKSLVYSVKLKMEFKILNDLVDLTQTRRDSTTRWGMTGLDGNLKAPSAPYGLTFEPYVGKRSSNQSQSGHSVSIASGSTAFAHGEDVEGIRSKICGLDDGILVMKTTEVNVIQEEQDVNGMSGARRGSIDLGSLELRLKHPTSPDVIWE
jgi:hypothetical protein